MCALMGSAASAQAAQNDTVVLLHGIGHSKWNMYGAERALRRQGYDVVNVTYPSLRHDIKTLTAFVHDDFKRRDLWAARGRVHFVTHSMGGVITGNYLEAYKDELPMEKLGRVVMLAPPHGGSEIADLLKNFPPYRWTFGPAGQELTTAARSQRRVKPYYDLGIIAGSKGWPYVVARFIIPGAHDGRVAIEKSKLEGMKDHVIMPATHSFISWKPSVHRQIVHFLKEGGFQHET